MTWTGSARRAGPAQQGSAVGEPHGAWARPFGRGSISMQIDRDGALRAEGVEIRRPHAAAPQGAVHQQQRCRAVGGAFRGRDGLNGPRHRGLLSFRKRVTPLGGGSGQGGGFPPGPG
jgi:hypothetical protein